MPSFYLKLLLIACLTLGLIAWLAGVPLLENLVDAAYTGNSLDYLDKLLAKDRLKDPQNRTLAYYQERGIQTFERLILLYFAALALAALALFRGRQHLVSFFAAVASPINLAVFRIVLFAQLLVFGPKLAIELSHLPETALVPPPGWGWFLNLLPPKPYLIEGLVWLFQVCCIAGLFGVFTRTAAAGASIIGLYVMGVPQFFGKIDHYHFLWWFTVLLATSPSGHALSVDSARKAMSPEITPAVPGRQYALPLRFAWLLIGLIYFFPGFWKFVISGTDWALSDNLKFKMYAKWFELGGWEPFFRLDHYPFLYKSGGILTMTLEMGFIFAMLWGPTRIAFILGGLIFHLTNDLFLHIHFTHLMVIYVVFLDWHTLFGRLSRHLFQKRAVLFYAPDTPGQRRAALVRSLDFFGAVDYSPEARELSCPAIRLSLNGEPAKGMAFWTVLISRVPLVLLALPFFIIPNRTSSFHTNTENRPSPVSLRPVTLVGLLLLVANSFCGFALIDSWPFAVYPTFASIDKPQAPSMIIIVNDAKEYPLAQTVPMKNDHFKTSFGSPSRLRAYLNLLLSQDPKQNIDGFKALWELWQQTDENLEGAVAVHFYRAMFSTVPEDRYRVYSNPRLVLSLEVEDE